MIDFKELLKTTTNRIIAFTVVVHVVITALFADAPNVFEMFSWNTPFFEVWQPLTHVFLHANWMHLLFNMLGLWFFGQVLERVWGGQRLLIFYLLCGVGAGIISQLVDHFVLQEIGNRMVGASGAIYGVLVAFALMFPNQKIMLIFLPVPIAAKVLVPIILMIDLSSGVTGIAIFGANIAHFAHLGGAMMGAALCLAWRKGHF